MRRTHRSVALAVAVLSIVVVSAAHAGAQIPELPTACPESDVGYVVSKCADWYKLDSADQAFAAGVSPDGATTYAFGSDYGNNGMATVAYNSATGEVRWRSTFQRPGGSLSTQARDMAVSPDGSTVYATGFSNEGSGMSKIATVAYDAATGAEKWVRFFQSQWAHGDYGYHITVAPDSQTVYVGGTSYHTNPDLTDNRSDDFRVIAYGADGTQKWTRSMDSTENQFGAGDMVEAIAVSPDGNHVVVGGRWGTPDGYNFGTFSLNAGTGATEWFDKYTGGVERFDLLNDIAFSPDSSRVFVTGDSYGGFGYQRATVAYNVGNGSRLWVARFVGTGNWADFGKALAVSPDGEVVYVTGESVGSPVPRVVPTAPGVGVTADIGTQALDADTGDQIWEARYSVPRGSAGQDIVVSPDGSRIYVTGMTWTFTTGWNIVTIAYETGLGLEQWVARYTNKESLIGNQDDWDPFIAIAPDGAKVFVVGTAVWSSALITLAYSTTEIAD